MFGLLLENVQAIFVYLESSSIYMLKTMTQYVDQF
jgi:hypothetical protein